jgi:hypothetical protein
MVQVTGVQEESGKQKPRSCRAQENGARKRRIKSYVLTPNRYLRVGGFEKDSAFVSE